MPDFRGRRQGGFSLFEVILVMALISILSAVSVLSFAYFIPGLRLKSAAQEINIQVQKARLEAIRTRQTCHVEFFRTVDGVLCGPVVWLDKDRDGTLDPGEKSFCMELVEDFPGVRGVRSYGGIGFDNALGGDGVTFAGDRTAFNSRGVSTTAGSVRLINSRGQTKQLLVTLGGAVRVF